MYVLFLCGGISLLGEREKKKSSFPLLLFLARHPPALLDDLHLLFVLAAVVAHEAGIYSNIQIIVYIFNGKSVCGEYRMVLRFVFFPMQVFLPTPRHLVMLYGLLDLKRRKVNSFVPNLLENDFQYSPASVRLDEVVPELLLPALPPLLPPLPPPSPPPPSSSALPVPLRSVCGGKEKGKFEFFSYIPFFVLEGKVGLRRAPAR